MGNYALETMLFCAGFALILLSLSDGFQQWLLCLQAALQLRPRWKVVAYPAAALLFLGVAALVIQTLMSFAALRFSYD